MSNEKFNLGRLLNDDSFIHWLKEDDQLSESEKKEWDDWLSSDARNEHLLKKAKKIIQMPFKEVEEDCDSAELARLKKSIREENEKSE